MTERRPKQNARFFAALFSFFLFISFSSPLTAGDDLSKLKSVTPSKVTGSPRATLMNINNITMWAGDNGTLERRPDLTAGVEFPAGGPTVVYAGGLVWGGLVRDSGSQILRVGGQTYHYGTVPGAIVRPGIAESPSNADVRIYRIRRDWSTADLTKDAAEYFDVGELDVTPDQINALRSQYKKDWQEWPWQKGAPYYERNGIPGYQAPSSDKYDPTEDEPGLGGADQVIWYVANDLDPVATQNLYGSIPIGMEMQVTCWAYHGKGDLENVIYERYRLIYKGKSTTPAGARIDSMYISKWVDPDVGNYADDYAGSDPGLGMGFAYNSTANDREFDKVNLVPPAIGYDIVQGPRVPQPGAVAHWNMQEVPGYTNLPTARFTYFTGDTRTSDFDFNAYRGTQEWWNIFRGYIPFPLSPLQCSLDPVTHQCAPYELWGDPETLRGWVDGRQDPAGDRRFALISGPFSMALGDTQEVVISLMGAIGKDNRDGVGVLKKIDGSAQDAFNFDFDFPTSFPKPPLHIVELDKKFILDWESDTAQAHLVESFQSKGYTFETYNIYQFASPGSTIDQATAFPPFDITLPRSLNVSKDLIRNRALVNGQKYYYAVTAVYYNSDPQIANQRIESPLEIITGIPHSPNPGIVYPYSLGSDAGTPSNIRNFVGVNDAVVKPVYYDPTRPDDHQYKIRFHRSPNQLIDIDEKPTWDFIDISEYISGTIVGSDGSQTLLHTINGGTSWKQQSTASAQELQGVSFSDVSTGNAVGAAGTILRTSDGGDSWVTRNSGFLLSLFGVCAIDSGVIFAAGADGTMLQTADAGVTWSKRNVPTLDTLRSVSFYDLLRGVAAGDNGTIIHTVNGGTTWYRDNDTVLTRFNAVVNPFLNIEFAVGNQGTILRTTDGGASWTTLSSGTTQDLYGVSFADANTGLAVGSGGVVLRTTNRGVSWSTQSSGTTNDLFSVSLSDSAAGTAVGAKGTIIRTTDAGATWNIQSSGTTNTLRAVNMTNDNRLVKTVRIDSPPQRIITRGMTVEVTSPQFGLRGVYQTTSHSKPSHDNVFNIPNPSSNYMVIGQGFSDLDTIKGGNIFDVDLELRFNGDSSWALFRRVNAPASLWVRVPYTAWGVGVVGKDSFNIQLFTVITDQGGDSVWHSDVLLDRAYNGKTLKEFYPVSIIDDSINVNDIFYGTYYEDAPYRPDADYIKGYLWVSSQSEQERSVGIWKAYIADLDEDGVAVPKGTVIRFERYKFVRNREEKIFSPQAVVTDNLQAARSEVDLVNVFPNPYYGQNRAEVDRFHRFVTFNHLPQVAAIRIFNLAGVMVRTILKDDATQFASWDLNNELGLPVGGGLYLAHIELRDRRGTDLGTKELKLMIVPEVQQVEGR